MDRRLSFDELLKLNISLIAAPQHEISVSLDHGECVPQRGYKRGTGRSLSANVKEGLVLFFLENGSMLPVSKALGKDYTGLLRRDEPALPDVGKTVSVRFGWPGYPPQDYQLRMIDWSTPPKRIPVSKLAGEVAKLVRKYILETQEIAIAPEHDKWRVGPGGIQIEHLSLAAFEQASVGSWQVRLFYKRPD